MLTTKTHGKNKKQPEKPKTVQEAMDTKTLDLIQALVDRSSYEVVNWLITELNNWYKEDVLALAPDNVIRTLQILELNAKKAQEYLNEERETSNVTTEVKNPDKAGV